jgi:hypothetical protein
MQPECDNLPSACSSFPSQSSRLMSHSGFRVHQGR